MKTNKTIAATAADFQATLTNELGNVIKKDISSFIYGWHMSPFEKEMTCEYAWERVILQKSKYKPDGGAKFTTWAKTVARRAAIDKWRQFLNDPLHEDDFGDDFEAKERALTPHEGIRDFTRQLHYHTTLETLKKIVLSYCGRDRIVAQMLIDERTKEEIMAETGMTGGNVDTTICRVRKKMRSDLRVAGYDFAA